jgi:DinB superfamily
MQAVIDLSYPIGKFDWKERIASDKRAERIAIVAGAPARFREAVRGLDDAQLDTPYRPGGWTVRQLTHHVGDSHMNGFLRFRWALTEQNPALRGYDQVKWSELHDSKTLPVEPSLTLLEGLHARWTDLLRSMTDADFERTIEHSELGPLRLEQVLALYAWHTRHHATHITALRERMGWASA